MYQGDSVEVLKGMPDDSVGLSVSSWPFSDQYMYSASYRDFGNVSDDQEFFEQLDYLLPDLLRVHIPGRLAAVHCKDRIIYGTKSKVGSMHIEPFSDKCVQAMIKHGWLYFGRIFISTDVVRENSQTHRLTQKEFRKDASKIGVGMPEYLLLFRKPPMDGTWSDEPVKQPDKEAYSVSRHQIDSHDLWRSSGNRLLYPWEANGIYDYQAHIKHIEKHIAPRKGSGAAMLEPVPSDNPWVWCDQIDVSRLNVLNYEIARGDQDEKHICPLQLDVIERCIERWSNAGDVVLDYFAGVGSVPHQAISQGRRGVGIELKEEYFNWAVRYCQTKEEALKTPTLFDLAEVAA